MKGHCEAAPQELPKQSNGLRDCLAAKSAARNDVAAIVLLIFLAGLVIFFAGIQARPSLGDEIHHFRFAKDCFAVKGRALFDSVYGSPKPPGFYYDTEIAWPFGLSLIWRAIGQISFKAAQAYQTFFYFLMAGATFLLGRRLYGKKEGLIAALLAATAPMMVSFGTLFYIDLPAAALATLSLWLFFIPQYFLLGCLLGLQYIMKRSAIFFLPAILLLLVWRYRKNWKAIFPASLQILVPAALIYFCETAWRKAHLLNNFSMGSWMMERFRAFRWSAEMPWFLQKAGDFSNSSLLNPVQAVQYLGVPLLAGFGIYAASRSFQKKDGNLFFLGGLFLAICFFLKLFPDIRYTMPVVPLLAILSARGWLRFEKSKAAAVLVAAVCMLQLGAAAFYTAGQRKVPAGIRQGFEFAKANIPADAYTLYPEANFSEYTGRPMVWGRINVRDLFWSEEPDKIQQILYWPLSYIAVKKSRIYDDRAAEKLHVGGYPQSFLDWLNQWPYAKKVFDNPEMSIYEMDLEKLK